MHLPVATLAGFQGLRAELLVALRKRQPVTAKELADGFGLTPNALRRHLKAMEEAELVCYRPVVRGVGAPVFAYSLSEAGEALFPRSYELALAEALESVRAEGGSEAVRGVFVRRWDAQAGDAVGELAKLAPADRAQLLAELLTAEGYMAAAEMDSETTGRLRVHNCAVRGVAARFPEACDAELRFLERALGATLERGEHIAGGCNTCTYQVRFTTGADAGRDAGPEAGAPRASPARSAAGGGIDTTQDHGIDHDRPMAVAQEKA